MIESFSLEETLGSRLVQPLAAASQSRVFVTLDPAHLPVDLNTMHTCTLTVIP